jgi:hypothetical protein
MRRERMFHAAFQSRSAVNPHDGQECSRIHNGLSDGTPYAAHSFDVPQGITKINSQQSTCLTVSKADSP